LETFLLPMDLTPVTSGGHPHGFNRSTDYHCE
jgi:hypothetical protein